MSDFLIYFQIGLHHVLNIHAYDHILFLACLSIPYAFSDWKRVVFLISMFTIGHTTAMLLSLYDVLVLKARIVETLIPITIALTALFNLFTAGKSGKTNSINLVFLVTLFFGIVHGLAFANDFKAILSGSTTSKLIPLAEFALGIEAAQIVVVFVTLIFSYLAQTVFRFSKRDWTLVLSALIIGIVIPLILQNQNWK